MKVGVSMKDKSLKKKKLPKVLLTIVLIIGAAAGFIAFNASRNMKVMNRTLESGMKALSEYAEVTPVDAGDFEQIKMYGFMKFNVSQYDVRDLGNLSVMTVNMGFMQMVSYVITPYEWTSCIYSENERLMLSFTTLFPTGQTAVIQTCLTH